jgi:hypothetical protein
MRLCSDRNISDHLRKWRSFMRRVPGWIISDNLRQARRLYALRSRPDQLGPVAVRHHAIMESAYATGSVLAWESGSRSLSERCPRATANGVVPQREPGLRTLHSDAPNG